MDALGVAVFFFLQYLQSSVVHNMLYYILVEGTPLWKSVSYIVADVTGLA